MPGYFNLTLDTTPPQNITVKLNDGNRYTENRAVTLYVGTSDTNTYGYSMKVWGDIEDISLEESAVWTDYEPEKEIILSEEDSEKYVHIKLKDNVGNVTNQYSANIRLNTSGRQIIDMKDHYTWDGIGNAATFYLDNKTQQLLGDGLRQLIGKVVTLTGDYIVGFGNQGDNPLGHIEHIGYDSSGMDNLVVTVSWCNTINVKCNFDVSEGDFLSCDGNGGLMKSITKTSAKAWSVVSGICTAYICG